MSTATFGTARHPFRATLPLRTLRRLPRHEPEVQARIDAFETVDAFAAFNRPPAQASARRRFISAQDVKDFLLAYSACLLAVLAFLG